MERANRRVMSRLMKEMARALDEWLSTRAPTRADARTPTVNAGSVDEATAGFLGRMRTFNARGPDGRPEWYPKWEAEVDQAGDMILRKSAQDFGALGITPAIGSTVAAQLADGKAQALEQIIALSERQVERLGNVLAENAGLGTRELQKKIEAAFSGAESGSLDSLLGTARLNAERHANLLARDQVLTAHSKLTQARMKDAGVVEYVWTTARDDRVRDRHADVDGQTFNMEEGAPGVLADGGNGNPGEDYQCRCVMFPVTPLLT